MTITSLPEPGRNGENSATFNPKMYAFVEALWEVFLDLPAALINIDAAVATVTSGLGAGLWVSGATYAVGNLCFDPTDGRLYRRRLTDGAGTTRPGLDATNWSLQTLPDLTLVAVTGTTHTAAANTDCWLTNSASSELMLPDSPSVGDTVRAGFANGRTDNWVRRNSQFIMGLAEDMLIDIPYWARRLRFVGGTTGWALMR